MISYCTKCRNQVRAAACQRFLTPFLLLLFLLPMLGSVSLAEQYADPLPCDTAVDDALEAPRCAEAAWWATADLVYWQAHLRSLDYAASEDGTSLALGAGQTHRVDFDRDAGIRTELGYMTQVGWGLGVSFTGFTTEGDASVVRPAGVGQLFSTLSHPGGPEEADVASATTTFDYKTFDVLARCRLIDERFKGIDLFGGLRWAKIRHNLTAVYDGRDFVNGLVDDQIDIDALGFLFGGQVHWRLARGWSVFGRSSLGAMYGRFDDWRLETNLDGLEQLVDYRDSYQQPMLNFDSRLGLSKAIGNLQVRAGYDLNIWTSLGDRVLFVDDIEEATFTSSAGDVLLEGFFLQLVHSW